MKVKLDEGAIMPTRAHELDAGFDLYMPKVINDKVLIPCSLLTTIKVDTGVHVEIPRGYVGMIKSRSSMYSNGVMTEGVIDSGYTGSIKVVLRWVDVMSDVKFSGGEKIAQLVIVPCYTPELEQVDELEDTERGSNGFGSSGK